MRSLQQRSAIDTTQPYHIYYDLDINNNDTTGLNEPPDLRFTEIRNSPYLMAPENYFMSVTRFTLQTPSLPNFIPQVMLGQTDINKTIYSITLKYKTFEFQQFVAFVPNDLSQPLPDLPLDIQDLTSAYYFVKTYQEWIEMINTAFISAFTGLAASIQLPTTHAPFMEFDPQALICILNADEVGYARTLIDPIEIYMNAPLFNLFSSFPATCYGYQNITNGKNYKFDIFSNNGANILNLTDYNAIQMYQENTTCGLWNPIQSIVFTTALLPINPSLISAPKIFGADSNLFNLGNNANIAPIITDFTVPFSATNTYKPTVEYVAGGEYRLYDMFGSSPLNAIELSVFWKDTFGIMHPFKLNSGCCATIKLLFRRKDFNTTALIKNY